MFEIKFRKLSIRKYFFKSADRQQSSINYLFDFRNIQVINWFNPGESLSTKLTNIEKGKRTIEC